MNTIEEFRHHVKNHREGHCPCEEEVDDDGKPYPTLEEEFVLIRRNLLEQIADAREILTHNCSFGTTEDGRTGFCAVCLADGEA